jgi:hypothetical protein
LASDPYSLLVLHKCTTTQRTLYNNNEYISKQHWINRSPFSIHLAISIGAAEVPVKSISQLSPAAAPHFVFQENLNVPLDFGSAIR